MNKAELIEHVLAVSRSARVDGLPIPKAITLPAPEFDDIVDEIYAECFGSYRNPERAMQATEPLRNPPWRLCGVEIRRYPPRASQGTARGAGDTVSWHAD